VLGFIRSREGEKSGKYAGSLPGILPVLTPCRQERIYFINILNPKPQNALPATDE